MFNDLVNLFEEENWKWSDGAGTHGKNFMYNLRDALWYIDGHHSTLEARSCPVPDPFSQFVGYNVPERSKHQKRKHSNLNYESLVKHVAVLQESVLTSWMQQSKWSILRERVCTLATMMDDYCTYLRLKSKAAKVENNSSASSSSSDSGSVLVLPMVTVVSWRLKELDKVVQERPCYERITVNDYCSVDPKKKYQYMQDL